MVTQEEQTGLYLSGQPVKVKECNIVIIPPKIKDIVLFGEDNFLIGTNLLGHTDKIVNKIKEGNPLLESYDDFQLLLIMLKEESTIKETVLDFLSFICPDYIVELTDNAIQFFIIQDEIKKLIGQIYPFNFKNFQIILNDLFEIQQKDKSEPDYNPINEAAAAIAKKIEAGRARKKQRQLQTESPQSIFGRYASILSIGMHMDINIFFNYTPFQLCDAFNRYFLKVQHDLYMKVSTTPLMDVSSMEQPEA